MPNEVPVRASGFRWVICGLLFVATTMNYLDRSVLNVISPQLSKIIGWNPAQFGLINAAWTAGYAVGFLIMGRLVDRVGTRFGYAISLTLWSLAAAATGLTHTVFAFGVSRLFLGLFEAGNFPAAVRTTAEWFPQRQRATATGLFNAGSNIGAILAPLSVPFLMLRFGWQSAFIVTGAAGVLWVLIWLPLYTVPGRSRFANDAERKLIAEGYSVEGDSVEVESIAPPTDSPVPWRDILRYRHCWAIMTGTDPIWWFYLFWSGDFLATRFYADIKHIGLPLIVIYTMADVGSIGGGWLSSTLLKRGYSANVARKAALLICGFCVLPVSMVTFANNMWSAVLILGLAAAAHQGFSANMMTLASDLFPKRAVASVAGLGGLAGALGGAIMQYGSGVVINATGSFTVPFMVASLAYLLAVVIMHLLSPDFVPVETVSDRRGFEVVM